MLTELQNIALIYESSVLRLDEAMTQRQFWDFYAVYTNGLDPVEGVDTKHIVDEAWTEVVDCIVEMVYGRIIKDAIIDISNIDRKSLPWGTTDWAPQAIAQIKDESLHKHWTANTTEEKLDALKWFTSMSDAFKGKWLSDFTTADGMWAKLASAIVEQSRLKRAGTKAKAMSVDKMLAWSHHNGSIADYFGKWLNLALDARARGNMNTILQYCSPYIRDALKSASHGIGTPYFGPIEQAEMELSRDERVKNVRREGDYLIVTQKTIKFIPAPEYGIEYYMHTYKFTVTKDELINFNGERVPMLDTFGGRTTKNRISGAIFKFTPYQYGERLDPPKENPNPRG